MTRFRFPALAAVAVAATVAALLAGCATGPSAADLDRQTLAAVQASFRDQGIAKVDRIKQDLGQSACSSDKPPPEAVVERITAEARATAVDTIRQRRGGAVSAEGTRTYEGG